MTGTAALSAPQTCTRPPPTHASTRDSWTLMGKSGSISCGVTAPFSWILVHTRFCLCSPRVCFPSHVSSGSSTVGLMAHLLQEGLCHTQVYWTQSPCPCSSPLLIYTSSRDTQTQVYLSLCGISGSWCTQGMFEPSEHLWQVWGLTLNVILPLLPSCRGFSALRRGVSPHSCYSAVQSLLHGITDK